MLAFVEGKIVCAEPDGVVVAVHGVGYRVYTSRQPGGVGDDIRLWVYEVIREDRFDLFGFVSRDELSFFERLLTIDGVGPKMALKILSAGTLDTVRGRILAGDLSFLTGISGVGKKTAQKIILELQGTIVSDAATAQGDGEVIDALTSLGYVRTDLEAVLPHLRGTTTEARIKEALQMLGKHR